MQVFSHGYGWVEKKKIYIDQINFGDDSQNGTKNDFKNKETRKEKKKKCSANGEAESYMEKNKKKAAKVI